MFRLIHSSVCAVFFFKQKTAYEMRICDWSSDVCSSDLLAHALALVAGEPARKSKGDYLAARRALDYLQANSTRVVALEELEAATGRDRWSLSRDFRQIGRASCMDSGCHYVYISVVDVSYTKNTQTITSSTLSTY